MKYAKILTTLFAVMLLNTGLAAAEEAAPALTPEEQAQIEAEVAAQIRAETASASPEEKAKVEEAIKAVEAAQ